MTLVLRLQFAFLGCAVGSAFVLNLTSLTSSQRAPNITITSAIRDNLRLDNEVPTLISEARCNGPNSGVGLTNARCQEALTHGIPHVTSSSEITYGDRRIGNFDVNLPQRYVSGDGRCVVDLTLRDIHKEARDFPLGIAMAALTPIAECVQGKKPPQGGTIENFDQTHNMRVVVQSYEPKVVCVGQTATRDISQSCQSLLDTMLISETPMTFGYVAGSVERMPYSRVSKDRLCVLEIDTTGVRSDVASWKEFWEIGVALNGVCIRRGQEGFQFNIGAMGGLHMELRDNRNP